MIWSGSPTPSASCSRGERESAAVRIIRVRHADGHWVTLEAHSRHLTSPAGLLVVSRDVTEQAKLEEDLHHPRPRRPPAAQAGPAEPAVQRRQVQPRGRQRSPGLEPVPGGWLRIKVTDTGLGIPADAIGRLFVPFERVASQPSAIEGTGLGLPLSKRLAEAMGGTLELVSIPQQGSTFWIELPMVEAPVQQVERQLQDAPAPDTTEAAPPGPDLTVLYIEDNLSNLQLVERVLGHRAGVRLISAMRPQLGLDLSAQHHPDLILLDRHLPDMPGEAVLRRLRTSPVTADIPVAILSADARPALIERLLGEGVRGFLTKPLDVKELLALVDGITAEREQAAAAR
jgi:CheY-like chemotaxis protein